MNPRPLLYFRFVYLENMEFFGILSATRKMCSPKNVAIDFRRILTSIHICLFSFQWIRCRGYTKLSRIREHEFIDIEQHSHRSEYICYRLCSS